MNRILFLLVATVVTLVLPFALTYWLVEDRIKGAPSD